jgi:TM2 domain-containing membrane protein YozV
MKSTGVAYLLWLIGGFGALGLHRFYTGNAVSGLIWFFTGGLLGIGAFVDLFLIPGLVRDAGRSN